MRNFLLSTYRQRDRDSERGATMVELAIVLPLFFLLVFLIFDFSRIVSRRTLISNTLRNTVRIVAAIPPPRTLDDCQNTARARVLAELEGFGLQGSVLNPNADIILSRDAALEADFGIPVLRLRINARVDCITCPVLRLGTLALLGDDGAFDFRSFAIAPLESVQSCTP